jgi:predicted nucleic acid-binding protein
LRRPHLRDRPRVCIDSNVYFYSYIGDPKYGSSCRGVLADVQAGLLDGFSSVLVVPEACNATRKAGRQQDMPAMASAITSLPLTLVDVTEAIVTTAASLAKQARGDPYDGTHAATAQSLGIKTIVSTDSDFDRFPGLVRLDPSSYRQRSGLSGDRATAV